MVSFQDPNLKEMLVVKDVEMRDQKVLKQAEPVEDIVEIPLDVNEPSRIVYLG